eukprot:Nk52_evm37s296 gene=Nk52_evmTU37s296
MVSLFSQVTSLTALTSNGLTAGAMLCNSAAFVQVLNTIKTNCHCPGRNDYASSSSRTAIQTNPEPLTESFSSSGGGGSSSSSPSKVEWVRFVRPLFHIYWPWSQQLLRPLVVAMIVSNYHQYYYTMCPYWGIAGSCAAFIGIWTKLAMHEEIKGLMTLGQPRRASSLALDAAEKGNNAPAGGEGNNSAHVSEEEMMWGYVERFGKKYHIRTLAALVAFAITVAKVFNGTLFAS